MTSSVIKTFSHSYFISYLWSRTLQHFKRLSGYSEKFSLQVFEFMVQHMYGFNETLRSTFENSLVQQTYVFFEKNVSEILIEFWSIFRILILLSGNCANMPKVSPVKILKEEVSFLKYSSKTMDCKASKIFLKSINTRKCPLRGHCLAPPGRRQRITL